ncbi:GNAT family N-acetyltransferase [Pseudoneobacillus sp. C159]
MEFVRATLQDKQLLKNMYSLYLHDLSAYSESLKPNEHGEFEFDSFEMIWEKEGLNPYFLKDGTKVIGFCLLLEPPFTKKVDYCINDLFIYNQFRGKGLAEQAVRLIFQEKQGSFYVSQIKANKRAVSFWKKMYDLYDIAYEETLELEDGEEVIYQTFTTKSTVKG